MNYLPRPAYYPEGYIQVPQGYMRAPHGYPPIQHHPGFPQGFRGNIPQQPQAVRVTPETIRMPLQHNEHVLWPSAEALPTESESSESESDSDSNSGDSTELLRGIPPPLQQAHYSVWNSPRERSRGRSASRHKRRSASHSVPRERLRRTSAPPPPVQEMAWDPRTVLDTYQRQERHLNPYQTAEQLPPQQQPLHQATPHHQLVPLPFIPQQQQQPVPQVTPYRFPARLPLVPQQQPIFHPQYVPPKGHQAPPPHGAQEEYLHQLHPNYVHPFQEFARMPPMQHLPVHGPEAGMHHVAPQPIVVPVPKGQRKRGGSMGRSKHDILPNHHSGKEAVMQGIIDPNQASGKTLRRVQLHPLLAPGCRGLMLFNAILPPARLTASKQNTINAYYPNPATSPPTNSFTFWTGVHEQPITIENPAGVTVANVLGYLGAMLFRKLERSRWNAFSEERREEITDWFHHNREVGHMPPVEKGIRIADLLSENTIFSGMELCQRLPNGQPAPPGTFVIRWGSNRSS